MDLSQLYLEAKAFNDGSIMAALWKREMENEKCFLGRRSGWRVVCRNHAHQVMRAEALETANEMGFMDLKEE